MYHMSVYSDVYLGIESIMTIITVRCSSGWMVYSDHLKVLFPITWDEIRDATPGLLEWIWWLLDMYLTR